MKTHAWRVALTSGWWLLAAVACEAATVTPVAGGGDKEPQALLRATEVTLDSYTHRQDAQGYFYLGESSNRDEVSAGFLRINPQGVVDRVFKLDPALGTVHVDDLAVDNEGNVYLAIPAIVRVLKVDPEGRCTVFAGDGSIEEKGDGGPATGAGLAGPEALAIDGEGNIYISEFYAIRKVDRAGIITTRHVYPPEHRWYWRAMTVDSLGNLYFNVWSQIWRKSPSGEMTLVAGSAQGGASGDGGKATEARLANINGMTLDRWGNLYFTDNDPDGNLFRLRKVDPSGIITTVAVFPPGDNSRLSVDRDGMVYVSAFRMPRPEPDQLLAVRFAPEVHTATATGSRLLLKGRYFGSLGAGGSVTLGGAPAQVVSWDNETIVCDVPSGAVSGEITLKTPDGQTSNAIRLEVSPGAGAPPPGSPAAPQR